MKESKFTIQTENCALKHQMSHLPLMLHNSIMVSTLAPSTPIFRRSTRNMCVSVPSVTMLYPVDKTKMMRYNLKLYGFYKWYNKYIYIP